MYTTLLPQGVEESYNRLLYTNIQISFELSWIESIGSVLDSMSFLACSLHCSQMAILFSAWHKDHMWTTLLPQGLKKNVIGALEYLCVKLFCIGRRGGG